MTASEKTRVKQLSAAMKKLKPRRLPKAVRMVGLAAAVIAGALLILCVVFLILVEIIDERQYWFIWLAFGFAYAVYGFFMLLKLNSSLGQIKNDVREDETQGGGCLGAQLAVLPFRAKDWNNMLYLKWLKMNIVGTVFLTVLTTVETVDYYAGYVSLKLGFAALFTYHLCNAVFLACCIGKERRKRLAFLWSLYFLIIFFLWLGVPYLDEIINNDILFVSRVNNLVFAARYAALILPFWLMVFVYERYSKKNNDACWDL